ncbi:MAG TPA: glycosyltransferase family 39 protein, partial [Candidatus Obscuribacterales bacterium]
AAAITINTYPALNQLSHSYLLDYPLAAMVSVALFALVFWQSSPSWTKTAMLGAALGLAFLSKQIGAAFLLGPASYYLIVHLKKDLEERNGFKTTRMLCTAGGIGIALFAPWLVYNSKALKEMGGYNIAHMGEQSFASNLTYYLQGVPHVMSPVLLALFLFSLAFMGRRYLKVITPALMSSIGGIIIISTISYTAPLDRYLTAGLVAPAIASGCLVAALWQKKHLPARLTAIALPSFALLQFVSFNFGQYPIASPQWLANLTQQSGVSLRGYRSSGGNAYDNPEPFKDWGHRWVIEQVDKYDRNIPVWVNILANSSAVNAHTYEFYAREMGKCMRPTTSRVWTMAGDTMTFSEESALYYKWYVIKSGRRGNIFKDKQSAEAEAKLIDFVTHSAKFEFKGRKPLPDGSSLSLYRQL